MATHTKDDFLKYAQDNGMSVGAGYSQADWDTSLKNPDFGISMINLKNDWNAAETPEEKAQINKRANQLRSYYGHYTGGSDGSGFYLDKPSPGSFEMKEAKPEFSYDLESDPVYSSYKKQYLREGQRATQDAMGSAAAATGGIPSSYAATAASQAGDYYASQLSDKVPELYQQAYNRHLNDLAQWNTDRNFNYGQHLDEINAKTADEQWDMQKAMYGAQYGDYSGLKKLGYDTSNIPEEWQKNFQFAQLGASYGDPRLLKSYFGIDASNSPEEWQKKYNLAQLGAAYGDYDPLENYFGIKADKGVVNADMLYKLGVAQANLGNYGFLNQLTGKYF